ncbi:MAG: hypothetical protein OXI15_02595, partial [Chromatiales bacterium]|nr:hypothetical protein [Chromatiales bacterium]
MLLGWIHRVAVIVAVDPGVGDAFLGARAPRVLSVRGTTSPVFIVSGTAPDEKVPVRGDLAVVRG